MVSDAFEKAVAQHYEPLYKFAFSLTRAEADARDLTQQTFYIWATKGHQLRDIAKMKTWLFTTLHRAFLETRRRQTRFPHHRLDEVPLDDLPAFSTDFATQVDSTQVLAALIQVDEVYQAAVALFYLEDYSYGQIAQILEVPIGTVKSRIARGISQLRQVLRICAPQCRSETTAERVRSAGPDWASSPDCLGSLVNRLTCTPPSWDRSPEVQLCGLQRSC